MEKQIGKIERKSHGSIGSFFFGWFIGLLTFILLVGGLGCFVYFKVSPSWINKTFKTSIDLGSDEANNLTISKVVSNAINLGRNSSTYTLNDLQKDFGIKINDKLAGINIADLKSVPFAEIVEAAKNKFTNISAEEVKELIDLSSMENILSKTNTYYYNSADEKLYKESEFTNELDFDYTLTDGVVTIKDKTFQVVDNKVEVEMRYIPLTKAFNSLTSDIGENVTLGELEQDYGVNLPKILKRMNPNTKVSELGEAIDNLQIAEILDYTITGNNVTDAEGQPVTGILATISKFTVSGLSNGIDNLTVADIFASEDLSSGALSLIAPTTKIDEIPTALSDALETATINDLQTKGIITINNYDSYKTKLTDVDKTNASGEPTGEKKTIAECNITELINDYFAKLDQLETVQP